jgi:hypothetical protein
LFDGFISCWDEKYRSNYIRPETAVNKYYDAEWRPYIQTPPFPEYTSGHAVISAAAAEVMTNIFGDNISYTDTSETEFGIAPRSFTSVRKAAEEAGTSRVYGGIHYKHSCDIGNAEGQTCWSVGDTAFAHEEIFFYVAGFRITCQQLLCRTPVLVCILQQGIVPGIDSVTISNLFF